MKKKFRYFLTNEDGLFYYTSGGQVYTTNVPTPLKYDPNDWHETSIRWARDFFLSGVFRSFSLSITFVQDGRQILAFIAATQRGYESKCKLVIEKLDTFDWQHKPYFSGDIDFSQGRLSKNQYQVEILDGGLASLLRAKQDTPYEIAINPGGAVKTLMDGIFLRTSYNYVPLGLSWTGTSGKLKSLPTAFTLQEGDYNVAVAAGQQLIDFELYSVGFVINNTEFANATFRATQAMDAIVDGNMQVRVKKTSLTGSDTLRVFLYVVDSTQTVKSITNLYIGPSLSNGQDQTFDISFSKSLTLASGDRIFLNIGSTPLQNNEFYITPNPPDQQIYKFAIRSTFRLPRTVASGDRYVDFCRKLIVDKICEGKYGFRSDFLGSPGTVLFDNRPYCTIVTSGDALRQIGTVTKPAKIKASLGESLKTGKTLWMLGLGVEQDAAGNEIVRMERDTHFFDKNSVICDLGEIEYPGQSFMQDMLYGSLDIGVARQDYDGTNGRDEFTLAGTYDFPTRSAPGKRWDMVAPHRWDMYGIEYARSQNIGKETTDDSSDDSVFLFEVNQAPTTFTIGGGSVTYHTLARRQNDLGNSATGLLFPSSAYNLSMTQKRCFLRNSPLIRASLWQQDDQVVKFQTSLKNGDVVSNLGSGQIVERGNVRVDSLGEPLYLPKLFEFNARAPKNFPDLMAANPYGRINFSVRIRGSLVQCGGFVDEVNIKPGSNDVAEWSLIVCPDVDLAKLV